MLAISPTSPPVDFGHVGSRVAVVRVQALLLCKGLRGYGSKIQARAVSGIQNLDGPTSLRVL